MKTIVLTDEEYYFIKALFERIDRKLHRKPPKKKWIKHDGLMINIETGKALDICTNRFCIDVDSELLAHLIETKENETNQGALSNSDDNDTTVL